MSRRKLSKSTGTDPEDIPARDPERTIPSSVGSSAQSSATASLPSVTESMSETTSESQASSKSVGLDEGSTEAGTHVVVGPMPVDSSSTQSTKEWLATQAAHLAQSGLSEYEGWDLIDLPGDDIEPLRPPAELFYYSQLVRKFPSVLQRSKSSFCSPPLLQDCCVVNLFARAFIDKLTYCTP